MSKIRAQIEVNLSPENLADLFWELNSEEQARFFKRLYSEHYGLFPLQMEYMRYSLDSEHLDFLKQIVE